MSLVFDVSTDQPPTPNRLAVQELALEEVASLAEELVVYHQHFAPLFSRREQRDWAAVASRADCSRPMSRRRECRSDGLAPVGGGAACGTAGAGPPAIHWGRQVGR